MALMAWCCDAFQERMGASVDRTFRIFYSYWEPPRPGRKRFWLSCWPEEPGSNPSQTPVRIFYCPWCGADLSLFPR